MTTALRSRDGASGSSEGTERVPLGLRHHSATPSMGRLALSLCLLGNPSAFGFR